MDNKIKISDLDEVNSEQFNELYVPVNASDGKTYKLNIKNLNDVIYVENRDITSVNNAKKGSLVYIKSGETRKLYIVDSIIKNDDGSTTIVSYTELSNNNGSGTSTPSTPSITEEVDVLGYEFTIQESESSGFGIENLLENNTASVIIESGTEYNYYFVKDDGSTSPLIIYLATNNEDGTRSDSQVTLNGSNNVVKYAPSQNILSFDMWATGDYGSFTLKITSGGSSEEVVILEYKFTIQEGESSGYGVEKLLANNTASVIIESGTEYNYYFTKSDGNSSPLIIYLATNNEDGTRSDSQVTLNGSNNVVKYTASKNILSFRMWATGDYGTFTLKITKTITIGGSSDIKTTNGLSFSVIGDSYSTYENWVPSGNSIYYPTGNVTNVKLTWWWKLANESGMSLLVNDSYSGSTICGTGYNGEDCLNTSSFIARAKANLGENNILKSKPNIIFIFGGTNDTWANSPLGTPKYSDWTNEDLRSTLPAFSYLIDYLQTWNPGCRIINIMNDMYVSQDMLDGMTTVCDYYGVENVSLGQIDVSDGHPTINGMEQIKNKVYIKIIK